MLTTVLLVNLVVLVADDGGWGDFSPYNPEAPPTPNIQALAHEGTTYTRMYVPSAVCTPYRATFLTGQHPEQWGFTVGLPAGTLPEEVVTLPERLRAAGWRTGHAGKYVGPLQLPGQFDFYDNAYQDPDTGQTAIPLEYEHATYYITVRGLEFLRGQNPDQPFYLQLWYTNQHWPVATRFIGLTGETENGFYDDATAELDWSVGVIVAELKRLGLYDDTIVVFGSDNGPIPTRYDEQGDILPPTSSGAYQQIVADDPERADPRYWVGGKNRNRFNDWPDGRSCKSHAHECGIRVATIVTGPGFRSGSPDNRPHSIMDFYATIENRYLGGIVYSHGVDLAETHGTHRIYSDSLDLRALIHREWKWYLSGELYDVVADPAETTDLSNVRPEVVAKIQILITP